MTVIFEEKCGTDFGNDYPLTFCKETVYSQTFQVI